MPVSLRYPIISVCFSLLAWHGYITSIIHYTRVDGYFFYIKALKMSSYGSDRWLFVKIDRKYSAQTIASLSMLLLEQASDVVLHCNTGMALGISLHTIFLFWTLPSV